MKGRLIKLTFFGMFLFVINICNVSAATISVDISWGSLSYDYLETWNPNTHQYDFVGWELTNENADRIIVTNNSDVKLNAHFGWELDSSQTTSSILGVFKDNSNNNITNKNLIAKNGNTVDSATAYLNLSGTPNNHRSLNESIIGKVTVTISALIITFNPNGGTVDRTECYYFSNELVGSLPVPTRAGKIFTGWWTAIDGGTQVDSNTSVGITSKTIYAHWIDRIVNNIEVEQHKSNN